MRSVSLAFATLFAACVSAQTTYFNITSFGPLSGLPESPVSAIAQDGFGYIWIASAQGLYRFDGYEARYFPPQEDSTLGPGIGRVHSLLCDPSGNMWIGGDTYFSYYDIRSGNFKTWYHGRYRLQWMIADMELTPSGLLWLTLLREGSGLCLTSFDPQTETFSGPVFHGTKTVTTGWTDRGLSLAQDNTGRIYCGTGNGLFRYDPATDSLEVFHPTRSQTEHYYGVACRGNTTVATCDDTVYVFSDFPNAYRAIPHPQPYGVLTTRFLNDSVLLFGTMPYGMWLMDLASGQFTDVAATPGMDLKKFGHIRATYTDNTGNLWISSSRGVLLVDRYREKMVYRGMLPVDETTEVVQMKPAGDGRVIMATNTHGLFVADLRPRTGQGSFTSLQVSGPAMIEGISAGTGGALWLGSDKDLYRVAPGSQVAVEVKPPSGKVVPPRYFHASDIYADSHGRVWIGGYGSVTLYTPGTGEWRWFLADTSASPTYPHRNYVTKITEDASGAIWICNRHGIDRFDEQSGRFVAFTDMAVIEHPEFTDILFDARGRLWAATNYQGLAAYDPATDKVARFSMANGFPADEIYSIAEDALGNIWCLSYSSGIIYVGSDMANVRHLTVSDGLLSNQPNAFLVTPDELILAFKGGSVQTMRLPLELEPDTLLTPVINDLRINGRSIRRSPNTVTTLTLPYDSNSVSVAFASLDFGTHPAIRYAYRITPGTGDWTDIGKARQAEFPNLQPGEYTLELRARDRTGNWGDPRVLHITVTPPWWQTWWFRVAMLLIAASAIFIIIRSFYRRRLRKQRERFEREEQLLNERVRIASELHDDLGSGLTKISLLSQVASKAEGEKREQSLGRISGESQAMVLKMNEIIWALNANNDTLSGLIAYIRKNAQTLFEVAEPKLIVTTPAQVPEVIIRGEQRRNIYMTVKEALHNALKYAQATEVRLTIELTGNALSISVTDNGRGFDGTVVPGHGNGLRNMKRRMEEIGGTFVITSGAGGTEVTLQCPLQL